MKAAKSKRYYWLKLKQDFFVDPRIKKLRRIAGGYTYTVILLKIMLLTVKTDEVLVYEGIENSLAMELALKLDEDDKNVEATLIYMQSMNLLQELDHQTFDIPQVRELMKSETDSAERKRRQRKREKETKSVTLSHQSHALVSSGHKIVPTEIESDPLFEKWLDEYTKKNAKNPPAYKAKLQEKIRKGNQAVIDTFNNWKNELLEKQRKEEEELKIKRFDYKKLIGGKIDGKLIESVATDESSLYVDLFLSDGSRRTCLKEEIYEQIHQKKEAINQ